MDGDDAIGAPTGAVEVEVTSMGSSGEDRFAKAREDSGGFFDDIDDREWDLLKKRCTHIQPNICPYCRGGDNSNAWFQNHYEPEFACRHERRIGRLGDGGKWVCDPHRITAKKDCLIYSVGSNNDFSFEEHVKKDIGEHCEIHTFDPGNYTEKAAEFGVHYHMWGIEYEPVLLIESCCCYYIVSHTISFLSRSF
jgi:hypothetical protein